MSNNESQPLLQVESLAGSHEGVRILKVHGPLTISNFFDFQRMTREDKSPLLIIDLADVPYMDSAALGAVVGVHISTGNRGSKYALINVAPRI